MASYHFRIKSDKKSDGSRVSASVHVDYISRQGKYKNEGTDLNTKSNLISFANTKNFGDDSFPLYLTDDFGKIFNTKKGLQINGKYSHTTLAIALTLAKNISDNQPIILQGSQKFKDKILATALDSHLNITFADQNLQNKFLALKNFSDENILSTEQLNYSELTSNKILQNLDDLKFKTSASSHFEYINREKAFKNRGDCIFTHHHLPTWANDNPKNFFKAADKYEGKNRRRYVEIEFSLPNELNSVDDYRKIIDHFIDLHLKDHYYAYAIHEKIGNLSDGVRHPHCHIMFSERLIDDVEKIQERKPENFFKYPARKKADGSEPTFQEKLNLGAPKNKIWNQNSKFVFQLREDFAKIQNEVLAEKGFSVRVDHRSLNAQRDDAIKNGDKFLAKVLDREPEKYLSPLPLDDNSPQVQQLKKSRAEKIATADKLFNDNFIAQKAAEENLTKKISDLTRDLFDISLRDEFTYEKTYNIKQMKADVLNLKKDINSLRRLFVSSSDAHQQAKLQYMSKSDRKLFLQFQDAKSRRDNLQTFLTDFQNISADFKSSSDFQEIQAAAKIKIHALDSFLSTLQKFVDEIELKLQEPSIKKNINIATHNILQQNIFLQQKLNVALDKLHQANLKLLAEFPIANPEQKAFTRDEFLTLLHRPYFHLSDTRASLNYKKMKLTDKLITLPRAKSMAQSIFVCSELKKLQKKKIVCEFKPAALFDVETEETYAMAMLNSKVSSDDLKVLQARAKELNGKFSAIDNDFIFYTNEDRDTFISDFKPQQIRDFKTIRQELRTLEKKKLKLSQIDFNDKKKSLDDELLFLKNLCSSSVAQKKIFDIAIGIIRKNKKFSVAISQLDQKIKSIDAQMQRLHRQMISSLSVPRNFSHSNPFVDAILNNNKKTQEVPPQEIPPQVFPTQNFSSTSTVTISQSSNSATNTSDKSILKNEIPPEFQSYIDAFKNVPPPDDLETSYLWIHLAQQNVKAERKKIYSALNNEFSKLIDVAVKNSPEFNALEVAKNSLVAKQKYYQDCKIKCEELNLKLLDLQNNSPQQFNFFGFTTSEYKARKKELAVTKHLLGQANDDERSASFAIEFARQNIKNAENALQHKRDSTKVSSPLLSSLESQLDELNKDLAYLNQFKSTVIASFRLTDTFKIIHQVNKKLSYKHQLSFDDIFAKSQYAKLNIKNFNYSPSVVRQMRHAEQAVKSSSGFSDLLKSLTKPLWDTSQPVPNATIVFESKIHRQI